MLWRAQGSQGDERQGGLTLAWRSHRGTRMAPVGAAQWHALFYGNDTSPSPSASFLPFSSIEGFFLSAY